MIMMHLRHEGEEASRFAEPGRRKERRMNIVSISSKNIEEGEEKKFVVRQKYRGRGGGKSGRSKYRQIAMLSAMATGSTTC